MIHRDVKPENVLVATPRELDEKASERSSEIGAPLVKITDFGIAKLLDAQGVTSTGQVLGSPAHMAPEQIEGGDVSARSDVFGLGVLLYEAMVGKLPFDGKNPAQVLRRVLEGSFTPADKALPTVGAGFAAIVGKALGHTQEERYASAADLVRGAAAGALRARFRRPAQGAALVLVQLGSVHGRLRVSHRRSTHLCAPNRRAMRGRSPLGGVPEPSARFPSERRGARGRGREPRPPRAAAPKLEERRSRDGREHGGRRDRLRAVPRRRG